ncbi:hypothetical protein MNBD_NITROSPINAE04-1683 [hydrothermal vent metagenome]|uniref:Uncharacterized protein n=1 Tax=hydrothermal vent metagenome TaxID=652676 RepID=A0A3B1CEJ9_9ZZZZ
MKTVDIWIVAVIVACCVVAPLIVYAVKKRKDAK